MPSLLIFLLVALLAGCTATRTIFGFADQEVTPQPVPDLQRINFEFPFVKAPDGTTYTDADLVALLLEPLGHLPEMAGRATVKQIGPGEYEITDAFSSSPVATSGVRFLTTAQPEYHIDEIVRIRMTPSADRSRYVVTADPRASQLREYRYEGASDGTRYRRDGLGIDASASRPDSPSFGFRSAPKKTSLAAKLADAAQSARAGQIRWTAKPVTHSKSYELPWPSESVASAVSKAFPDVTGLTGKPGVQLGQFLYDRTQVGFSLNPKSPTATVLTLVLESTPQWQLSFESRTVECLGCVSRTADAIEPAAAKIHTMLELMAPPVMATPTPTPPATSPARMCIVVSPGSANLRERPTTKSRLLKKLAKGTVGFQIAIESEWMKIELRGGLTGWVHRALIEPAACK